MPQKAHLNGSKGDPQKGIFCPQKCHFPDFPILTSVGGPWDRNVRNVVQKIVQKPPGKLSRRFPEKGPENPRPGHGQVGLTGYESVSWVCRCQTGVDFL